MTPEEVSEVAVVLTMAALRDIGQRLWHRLKICSCHAVWFLGEQPCSIGLEEVERARAIAYFDRWDALGLGYIGPSRF